MLIMQAQCFELTKDTLYFILMGDLWVVYYAYSKHKIFIHENASENIVCEMVVILFRG